MTTNDPKNSADVVTAKDLPPGYNTKDKDGLYAEFDDQGRLELYAYYVQGECMVSLAMEQQREYGRFENDYSGEIYFQHTVELISPWHDNASPKPTDSSLAEWARGCIRAVHAAAQRATEKPNRDQ